MKDMLEKIGDSCKKFRRGRGIPAEKIAEKCYVSASSVYAFEQGRTNNALILLEYVKLGLDLGGVIENDS